MNELNETPAERAHCEDGPSHLNALAVCCGHESAGGSKDANEGTAAHALLAYELDPAHNADPNEDPELAANLTPIMRGAAMWAANAARSIANGCPIITERRVQSRNGRFGTADISFTDEFGHLHVADFKSKSEESGAKSCKPQIMEYALMIQDMKAAEDGKDTVDGFERFVGHILHGGSRTVETFTFTAEEALETCADILAARRLWKENGSGKLKASSWCHTCACAAGCKTCRETALEAARESAIIAEQSKLGAVTEEQLVQAMAIKPAVEAWLRAVTEAAKAFPGDIMAANGVTFTRQEKSGSAPLTDLDGLWNFAAEHGVSSATFASICDISRTKVIAAIREAGPRKVWRGKEVPAITEEKAKEMVAPFYGTPCRVKYWKRAK